MNREPESGYDSFGVKRQYRRDVYAAFRRACPVPMAEARLLTLPGRKYTREIEAALDSGIREYNIIAVDWNPAIVARLRRRYSLVEVHGVSLIEAAKRLAKNHDRVELANIDLCGYIGRPLLTSARAVTANVLAATAVVALTWMRGRERGEWSEQQLTNTAPGTTKDWRHRNISQLIAGMHPIVERETSRELGRDLLKQGWFWWGTVAHSTYMTSCPMEWAAWKMVSYSEDEMLRNMVQVTRQWYLRLRGEILYRSQFDPRVYRKKSTFLPLIRRADKDLWPPREKEKPDDYLGAMASWRQRDAILTRGLRSYEALRVAWSRAI